MWHKIKIFFYSLWNFYRYFSVIYNDRHYDYSFILSLMERKIELMAVVMSKSKRYEGFERNVEKMNTCVSLLKKVRDEYYEMEHSDYHDTEWEFIPSDACEGCSEIKTVVISENFDDYFDKHRLATKRVLKNLEGIGSKHTQAIFVGIDRHNKAKEILFKMLDRNIESWWI